MARTKYYSDANYNAAFDRCINVMAQLILKYGHQVLKQQKTSANKADSKKSA